MQKKKKTEKKLPIAAVVESPTPLTPHNLKRSNLKCLQTEESGSFSGASCSLLVPSSAILRGFGPTNSCPIYHAAGSLSTHAHIYACRNCLKRMTFTSSLKERHQDKKVRADFHPLFLFKTFFLSLFFLISTCDL